MTKRNNEAVTIDAFGNLSNLDRNQDDSHRRNKYLQRNLIYNLHNFPSVKNGVTKNNGFS